MGTKIPTGSTMNTVHENLLKLEYMDKNLVVLALGYSTIKYHLEDWSYNQVMYTRLIIWRNAHTLAVV